MSMIGIKYINARCEYCKHKKLNLEETVIEDFSYPLSIRREYQICCEHEDICKMWINRMSDLHQSYTINAEDI